MTSPHMTREEIIAKYPDIYVNESGGSDSYQEGQSIIERDPVAVIIEHPTEEKVLVSMWKKSNWNGFLTGGIEGDDTLEQTVAKEIHEETGFKNIAKIVPTDFIAHGLFFHPIKNVNRLAHYHLVLVKLADLEQDEVSEEEKAIADFEWVDKSEVEKMLTQKDMRMLWQYFVEHAK